MRVGGFYKVPQKKEFSALAEELKWARDAALETVRWVATFAFPDLERDYEFVALRHPDEYPFNEGRLVSKKGLDIAVREFDQHFVEEHVAHSNALQARLKERDSYFVGPQARYNLNFDRLSGIAQESARSAGLGPECRNPFKHRQDRDAHQVPTQRAQLQQPTPPKETVSRLRRDAPGRRNHRAIGARPAVERDDPEELLRRMFGGARNDDAPAKGCVALNRAVTTLVS